MPREDGPSESESALVDRAHELDLIQTLGRRAAESRTPNELFATALRVLEPRGCWEAAAVCHGLDGQPELLFFVARPLSDALVAELRERAVRLMHWDPSAAVQVESHESRSYDRETPTRCDFEEEELLVLPLSRGSTPVAYLLVLTTARSAAAAHRLLYSAANQLSLHLDRIQSAREAEADRFRAILESMPQAVLMIDERSCWAQANRAGTELLERLGLRAAGPAAAAIDRLGLNDVVAEARAAGGSVAEREIVVDGSRAYNVTATRQGVHPDDHAVLFVLTDVTEGRRLQQQLAQSEKMSSLGQMISGVVHELNNPLATILGYAQLLGGTAKDPKLVDRMQVLQDEARRCQKIVQNLLSFARQRDPESRPTSLNEVARSVQSLMQYQLRVDNIELVLDLDSELPAMKGDAHQLQQVLVNLVTNARQATGRKSSGGVIAIRTATAPDSTLTLDVRDSGPGIPEAIRTRIFDPFFTTKAEGEGTGLGLSLVFGIVTSHQGTVEALADIPEGAVIRCRFPALAHAAPVPIETQEPTSAGPPLRSLHVLVVEDEGAFARVLCDALELDGHTTEWAEEGHDALLRLRAREFDLIVSDLRMPGMNGEELRREIERLDVAMLDRLIWTTGDTAPGQRRLGAEFERTLLHKPFDLEELRELVRHRLAADDRAR